MNSKILILLLILSTSAFSQDKFTVSPNIDLVSRYVWRGIDVASTPSAQPYIIFSYTNFNIGLWGAYTLSNQTASSDEIGTWLSYNLELGRVNIAPIITDYYYPNAGKSFFNFDAVTGAHLLEAGLIIGANDIPIMLAGYYNFYNKAGNNTYIELTYNTKINDINFNIFFGASGGSKENSLFYNTENFNVLNIGIKATKDILFSKDVTMPVFVSFIVNPRIEKAYLVAGLTL